MGKILHYKKYLELYVRIIQVQNYYHNGIINFFIYMLAAIIWLINMCFPFSCIVFLSVMILTTPMWR